MVLVSGFTSATGSERTDGSVVVASHARVSAEIIPMSQPVPMTAGDCEGTVCESVIGDNGHISEWYMYAPVANGECTFSTYWLPDYAVLGYGPELCNNTGGPAQYRSTWYDIDIYGSGFACGTVLHQVGKPCVGVY